MDWKTRTAKTVLFAKKYCTADTEDPNLWRDHVRLVRKYATLLAKKENADNHVVEIAALLHDIGKYRGREGHAERSYRLSQKFLKELKIPTTQRTLILKAIRKHSSKYAGDDDEIEVKVLRSADALGTFFNDEWQEHNRKNIPKNELLQLYDKTYKKIELESARKIVAPQLKKLRAILKE